MYIRSEIEVRINKMRQWVFHFSREKYDFFVWKKTCQSFVNMKFNFWSESMSVKICVI